MVILCFTFWGVTALISTAAAPLYIPRWQGARVPVSPRPHQRFYWFFEIMIILMAVKWCLIVVLIFISLMICNIEHLFMCLLAIYAYILWRDVYLSPLLISKLVVFFKFLSLILERGEGGRMREGGKHQCERETPIDCLPDTPRPETNLQSRPHPGIEPGDLSVCRMTPNRLSHTDPGQVGCLFYCCWIGGVLSILWISSAIWFANIFSHPAGCLFTQVIAPFIWETNSAGIAMATPSFFLF